LRTDIDIKPEPGIMNVEETAEYLRKSTSWVYKNKEALGGRKLGGSLFFPSKEDLYEHLFGKKERVEVRFHPEGNQTHRPMVQNKKRSKTSGSRKKKGGVEKYRITDQYNPDRHDIFGINK